MAAATGAGAVSEGMRRLTQLSLVSKVCSELESHLGVADRVLAEFVVDLGRASAFAARLTDQGAELLDYLAARSTPSSLPSPTTPPRRRRRRRQRMEDERFFFSFFSRVRGRNDGTARTGACATTWAEASGNEGVGQLLG